MEKNEELSDDTHLLEKWITQYKLGHIRQVTIRILVAEPFGEMNQAI